MFLRKCLGILLIIILPVLSYVNSLDNGLHLSDREPEVKNQLARLAKDPAGLLNLEAPPQPGRYRDSGLGCPAVMASFLFNYLLDGLNPFGYYLLNLLFHVLATLLVFYLGLAVFRDFEIALYASLLFGVSPFNSEVVNYIIARFSLFSSFFYLGAFIVFIGFRRSGHWLKSVACYMLSIVLFAFALYAQHSSVTLLAMILIYDFYLSYKDSGSKTFRLLSHVPFWILAVIFIASPLLPSGSVHFEQTHMTFSSFLLALRVAALDMWYTFFPFGLNVNHAVGEYPLTVSEVWGSVFLLACFTLLGSRVRIASNAIGSSRSRATARASFFFILWFFITLLPVLILPFFHRAALFQESRGYLPGVGIFMIIGVGLKLLRPKAVRVSLFTLLVIVFSLCTINRNGVWQTDLSLWQDSKSKPPVSYETWLNLGIANLELDRIADAEANFFRAFSMNPKSSDVTYYSGLISEYNDRQDEAEWFYLKTIELQPRHYYAHNNLGLLYKNNKRYEKSIMNFKQAIFIDYFNPEAHLNLGDTYKAMNNLHSAVIEYKVFSKVAPSSPHGYYKIGILYKSGGELRNALSYFREAVELDPENPKILFELALIYQKHDNRPKAMETYRHIIEIDPDHYDSRNNLGVLLEELGEWDNALREYSEALRLKPDSHTAHNNMGLLQIKRKNFEEAFREFRLSVQLNPNYIDARYNLASFYAVAGDRKRAVEEYRHVLKIALSDLRQLGRYVTMVERDMVRYGLNLN